MIASHRHAGLAAVLLVATGSAAHAKGDDVLLALEQRNTKVFKKIAPAVVFVANGKSFGSGFFVSSDGLILTNRHVVGKASKVEVVLRDGTRLPGRVVERAENLDLALIRIEKKETLQLPLGKASQLEVGSWVASVGHGRGMVWTYNAGLVSNVHTAADQESVFQTQIPLNPGNSGGPIVDRHGVVVGIVTAGLTESNSINFGIKIGSALRALSTLEPLCNCLVVHTPGREPIFLDGEMAGVGPRLALSVRAGDYEVFAVIEGKMRKRRIVFPSTEKVYLAGGGAPE